MTGETLTDERKDLAPLLRLLVNNQDLTYDQAYSAMDAVMSGHIDHIQLAGFLTALATKTETVTEIYGLADAMRAHARKLNVPNDVLDIVGTGGDGAHTVNISTMAAIVIAASGIPVVKHGNRASTSQCGAADMIESLGIRLDSSIEQVEKTFEALGLAFCFANMFHPSMRYAVPVRVGLGVPTVFNILGPLTNPAHARANAIGVFSEQKAEMVAGVFAARKADALVFRTVEPALDELSFFGENHIWETHDGVIDYHQIDLGRELNLFSAAHTLDIDILRGGDAAYNAAVTKAILTCDRESMKDMTKMRYRAIREAVLLNAASGVLAYNRSEGMRHGEGTLVERFAHAFEKVTYTLDSGAAGKLLNDWIEHSQRTDDDTVAN
ncbi:MAG: anthranilate phosphoribosyltransferase [Actinomycetaceae bacterium]|nr:anthranilate phosphoribosyltransferase [Actinomycetaceae bacterium]